MRGSLGKISIEIGERRLPLVGETPFWIGPLRDMTRRLGLEEWNTGGCFAFAEALAKAFDGEEWGICEFVADEGHPLGGDYPVHHAIVKIGDTFYDYRGVVNIENELNSVTGKKLYLLAKNNDEIDVFWFEDEFLGDEDMEFLESVLTI